MPYITSVERIGMEKGWKEGVYDVMYTVAHNAKDQGFSDDIIARFIGLDISSVHKILNNEPVDIPPRLLKSGDQFGTAGDLW